MKKTIMMSILTIAMSTPTFAAVTNLWSETQDETIIGSGGSRSARLTMQVAYTDNSDFGVSSFERTWYGDEDNSIAALSLQQNKAVSVTLSWTGLDDTFYTYHFGADLVVWDGTGTEAVSGAKYNWPSTYWLQENSGTKTFSFLYNGDDLFIDGNRYITNNNYFDIFGQANALKGTGDSRKVGIGARLDFTAPPAPVTVPAPGAILLAAMGSGLVGWLRRRRSL